ncbi:MAG TPA: ORF6N domain-containing protein [Spirochaetota bacterium]|nr:ORF6N domain-containing protein [Spirochaetota bacterium]
MAKKTTQLAIPDEIISSKIYLIRDKKVMLDRDLAGLYDIKAIRLREQVKRNLERFPENFMFQLSEKEVDILVSQNAIPSRKHLGGYLPYAFTEHGILMLANVIKSERAIKMSIRIIEIFVRMREMLLAYKDILHKLEEIERKYTDHDQKIMLIFEYLKQLEASKQQELEQKNRKPIGFKTPGKAKD